MSEGKSGEEDVQDILAATALKHPASGRHPRICCQASKTFIRTFGTTLKWDKLRQSAKLGKFWLVPHSPLLTTSEVAPPPTPPRGGGVRAGRRWTSPCRGWRPCPGSPAAGSPRRSARPRTAGDRHFRDTRGDPGFYIHTLIHEQRIEV